MIDVFMRDSLVAGVLVAFIPAALLLSGVFGGAKSTVVVKEQPVESEPMVDTSLADEVVVEKVWHATESGQLKVEGLVKSEGYGLMVSWVVYPDIATIPEIAYGVALPAVSVQSAGYAIQSGGRFSLSLPLSSNSGIAEVKIEYQDVVKRIEYDLRKKQ
jgi:hypothetical protein